MAPETPPVVEKVTPVPPLYGTPTVAVAGVSGLGERTIDFAKPVPLSGISCCADVTFRLLSVIVSVPEMEPMASGVKSKS